MTRSTAVRDRWRRGPVALAAWGGLALLGVVACVALWPAAQALPPAPGRSPVAVHTPAVQVPTAALTPAPEAMPDTATAPSMARAHAPVARAPSRRDDMPYRFIGRSTSGTETAIVLFGRGRVVSVRGPQALDDEYVVEAVFDDYLVLRHAPTGVGKFLALTQRQPVTEPPRNPEDSPRD